jgi:large repetitive protein
MSHHRHETQLLRRVLLTGALLTGLVGWVAPTPTQADPADTVVVCGQTLTADTRVANDLVNCHGNGLVIGADHITVDLAGHTVDGVNAPGSEGIADSGHGYVRIKNGTVKEFFLYGVALRHAPHSSVQGLTIRRIGAGGVVGDASAGVLLDNSAGSRVVATTVTNDVTAYQSDGIDVLSSPHALLMHTRLNRNAWDGAVLIDSPGSRVIANQFNHNQNQGVEVNAGSDWVHVVGNRASGNVASGIVVGAVSHARLACNVLTGNGDSGVFLFDLIDSRVTGNRLSGNALGIQLIGGQNGSSGNRVMHNKASRNLFVGIALFDHADSNMILANIADANKGQPGEGGGIIVSGASGNTVAKNFARRNLDVGIGVFDDQPGDSAGNTLRGNHAYRNRAHGIDAVDGTIDGGGNVAHRNTPAPNCLGVTCS